MGSIPRIDPSVLFVTVGQLRRVELVTLKNTPLVVQDGDERLAVVVPYGSFLAMQETIDRVERRVHELELRLAAADAAGKTLGDLVGGGLR